MGQQREQHTAADDIAEQHRKEERHRLSETHVAVQQQHPHLRRSGDDTLWAFAWVALLLFVPLVWWHYLGVAFAAIGVTLAGREELDDRLLAILPVLALVTMPITIANAGSQSFAALQAVFLVLAVIAVPVLAQVDLTRRQAFPPE